MTFPLGAVSDGRDSSENSTREGHPVADNMCIGPVSLPIDNLAFLPKLAI